MVNLLELAELAARPVIVTGLLASAGALLSKKGILTHPAGTATLAGCCFYLFIPALTFSNLASSVTVSKIVHLLPLMTNMTMCVLVGLVLGFLTSHIMGVEKENRNVIISVIGFKNVGNLPLVFIPSMCTGSTIFTKFLGDSCTRVGMSYVAIDICIATLLQFTIAIQLLKKRDFAEQNIDRHESLQPLLSVGSSGVIELQQAWTQEEEEEEEEPFPVQNATTDERALDNDLDGEPDAMNLWDCLKGINWKQLFPLPSQAALAGLLFGCISPLRSLLYGPTPVLAPIAEALDLLGQGVIPGAIPLLGSVLSKGPGDSKMPISQILGTVFVSLVIQPWVLSGLVVLFVKIGLYTAPDPMFLFVMMLANSTPGAVNLQTMTILFNNRAEEMAQILFWSYVSALLVLPVNVALFIQIITWFFPQ
ncbi:hypothetical protein M9434_002801 [Picochlorum sp. BPE23]|nr:hypothetical protein M9434_002801 [Picochlorum sp. BPE23]